ncbi:hypothetical protein H0H81_003280 [Sphagnurus paluster]|uniref:Actin cytoskeleton-regulatory complex protein SLA1 n=1 Tax=Sphagnurus paluster TaxID=117069 RepID=A0A9P7FT01_9AGAR|nr:hypothetical protein H0H81_003280 [Sphagnurus paluster]
MSVQHEEYLSVLKASYDYEPQSEDEIAIKEDQVLFLKEKVDDDWWKVKIKGESQEQEVPVGLVPAAYVEQAEHTAKVKVLYDYQAAADGELSVQEDEILLVFETEQDWILVQSEKEGGKAGFVPGNYVEPYSEDQAPAAPTIIVPPSVSRPVSTYVDPADRVASAKVTSDGIKTWSVSEIDKKGKKKKGTLGIGNGALFFASESDKTPVQKWQTADVQSVTSEKAKHVTIDIGGAAPINLHFHVGSRDNVEEITAKLKSSQALSGSSDTPNNSVIRSPSPEEAPPAKKATVHFSDSSPVIIPEPDDDEEEIEEEELPPAKILSVNGSITHGSDIKETGIALYDFTADGEDELSISEGEQLAILERDGDEWWKCRNSKGAEGVVPASYIEASLPSGSSPRVPVSASEEDEDNEVEEERRRIEATRVAKEQEAERAEQLRKKVEAQKRAKDAAAAELERKKRKEAAAARTISPPPTTETRKNSAQSNSGPSSGRPSGEHGRPPPDRTRVWHDRSGQFRVEAAFLGFNNGKLRLHKINGVIVEVPSEKMSVEDMKYVERITSKTPRPAPTRKLSEDDIPLGISRRTSAVVQNSPLSTTKKSPKIDWFDFFLSAGCDLDDCTRYAASFERDKLDESLLPDITEGTMRSLGVREGDIIRINKAIEKRRPTDNLQKPSAYTQEQVRRDEELARQLQAQEGGSRAPAPNLFAAGPGGALKTQTRRGRPTPSKSLPPATVDLKAISTVSDQIQRTSSPQILSPTIAPTTSSPVIAPPRSSSAAPITSGFDDDAWTNRPSSTKPVVGNPAPRAPSAPPASETSVAAAILPPAATPTPLAPPQTAIADPPAQSTPNLAKTTESDIFEQLSRLSELRKQSTPIPPPTSTSPTIVVPPNYTTGLGMGNSPSPMAAFQGSQMATPPPTQQVNGPRGPFAPVPSNQSLLQPLIPTQTGFGGMIPTRPNPAISPFSNNASPSFLTQQPTGFGPHQLMQPTISQPTGLPLSQPMMSQPTGMHLSQPMMSQPTGMPLNGFNSMQNASTFTPLNNQFTGFNPNFGQSPFNNTISSPPLPPLQSPPATNNTSPANIFAQMKSGTFATDNNNTLQPQQPGEF